MTSNFEIERITKRPIQYWFEDGLGELLTGSLFSIMGLFFLIQGWTTNSIVGYLAGILGMVAIGAGPWLSRFFLKKLKEKVIYPRTGYVKFTTLKRSRRILTGIVAIVVSSGLVVVAFQYERASVRFHLESVPAMRDGQSQFPDRLHCCIRGR